MSPKASRVARPASQVVWTYSPSDSSPSAFRIVFGNANNERSRTPGTLEADRLQAQLKKLEEAKKELGTRDAGCYFG